MARVHKERGAARVGGGDGGDEGGAVGADEARDPGEQGDGAPGEGRVRAGDMVGEGQARVGREGGVVQGQGAEEQHVDKAVERRSGNDPAVRDLACRLG